MPLTVDQVEALVDAVESRCRAMIVVQAASVYGRELLGLRVQDVNFLGRTVRIEYQRDRLTQQLVPPKTPRSRRTIPLPQVVADTLAAHLAQYEPAEDGGIFTMEDGRPYKHNHYHQKIINPAVKPSRLPPARTSHDLRHHFASILLAAGESVIAVAEYLGHTDATLVLGVIYGHLVQGRNDHMRRAIDSAWAARADRFRTDKISRDSDQR